ncbi:MAG: folate-binding protein [Paracoccaceae bacterium]
MITSGRTILRLSGPDTRDFLQGLVTNDVGKVDQGLVYAAMLTPQGKYLADFFLFSDAGDILLDVHDSLGDMLSQRLNMYKLRADVTLSQVELHLHRGLGPVPEDGYQDPRSQSLGWRAYRETPQAGDNSDWAALRVADMIPETGEELHPDTFILEAGFERLAGVDFRKGCYVGQEVTARMKHKTELRKGLARVLLSKPVPAGTEVTSDGKPVGRLHTVAANEAIAYLRFDRTGGEMAAGEATVELIERQ